MAFSSLKLASCSPLVPRNLKRETSTRPVVFVSAKEHRIQAKSNIIKATLKKDNDVSRREALSLVTGTIFLTSLVPADSASAKFSLLEKFQQLREKAGFKKEKEPKLDKKDPKNENKDLKIEKKDPKMEKKEETKEPKLEKKEEKTEPKGEKKEASPLVDPLKVSRG